MSDSIVMRTTGTVETLKSQGSYTIRLKKKPPLDHYILMQRDSVAGEVSWYSRHRTYLVEVQGEFTLSIGDVLKLAFHNLAERVTIDE